MLTALDALDTAVARVNLDARRQHRRYCTLVSAIVALAEQYRVSKNYAVSDQLRAALLDVGITVTQGTAGYTYDTIPAALRGRPVHDTWSESDA